VTKYLLVHQHLLSPLSDSSGVLAEIFKNNNATKQYQLIELNLKPKNVNKQINFAYTYHEIANFLFVQFTQPLCVEKLEIMPEGQRTKGYQ